jgi:hypothetical protein
MQHLVSTGKATLLLLQAKEENDMVQSSYPLCGAFGEKKIQIHLKAWNSQ